jgi:hypothetical protein
MTVQVKKVLFLVSGMAIGVAVFLPLLTLASAAGGFSEPSCGDLCWKNYSKCKSGCSDTECNRSCLELAGQCASCCSRESRPGRTVEP